MNEENGENSDEEVIVVDEGTFATLPRTTRGMSLVLGASPDNKTLVYCNGNSVIMRNIENPSICDIYTEHSTLTTVAKYAPSGYYMASGDQSGKVRVWDTTQKEHILKGEYPVINGPIKDIVWSPDSKRLAVVGEGRERFGHVFLFDTGTSNGSLSGQSKTMNSIDFRPERPYRIVSGSEDYTVAIFEGPPFKFKTLFHQHQRFVNCVRYQPVTGELFASGGADMKVFLYDGTEGTLVGELVDPKCKGNAHSGGIYALSWSPDGKQLLTASGDKTCKIWDVETKSVATTFNMGNTVDDQQLGCIWVGNHILSVSLSGFINYLDPNNPDKPLKIIKGHNKPITALNSGENGNLFTADFEGNITRWNSVTGENDRITPRLHQSQVPDLRITGEQLTSIGWDDTIAFTSGVNGEQINSLRPQTTKLASQPRGVATSKDGEMTVVACQKELCIFKSGTQVSSTKLNFEPTCCDLNINKLLIAVGAQDNKVHIFHASLTGASNQVKELPHGGAISQVKWSQDGKFLAASDATRRVVPYNVEKDFEVASQKDWTFHSARVNCLSWAPDGHHLASGGLDTNLIVWDLNQSGEHPIIIKGAHSMSQITGVTWSGPNTLVSVGQDSNIKQWTIHF